MKTSTIKLIAVLATSAGLLGASPAMAKGNKGGGGGGNSSRMSSMSGKSNKLSSNSFKLNSNSNISHSLNSNSSISSKKGVTLSQTFKKQDFKKDHNKNVSGLGISLGNKNLSKNFDKNLNKNFDKKFDKKFDNNLFCKKDYCKKDFCWWDSCYSKNCCNPWYFGCYYPTYSCYSPSYCYNPLYSCYDYCTPTYTTCNYGSYGSYNSSLTVLQNVEPSRTPVPVGSVLMVNGQAFGDNAGGARLRISGMAMPIEVLEWTPGGVKVRMPMVEINGGTPADIEVVRGDGSLAAKTAIVLTASTEQVALGR